MRILLPLVLIAILLSGCVSYQFVPVPDDGDRVEVIYIHGREVALSTLSDSTVALFVYHDGVHPFTLHVRYLNASDQKITVEPEVVSVKGVTGSRQKELRVYPPEEYIQHVRNMQAVALALQAVSGALQSANAGYSTTRSSGTFYSSAGYGSYSGTSVTYDPARRRQVEQDNRRELEESLRAYNAETVSLEQRLLRKTTLYPGGWIEGDILLDFEKAEEYIVQMPCGKNLHRMRFMLCEVGQ